MYVYIYIYIYIYALPRGGVTVQTTPQQRVHTFHVPSNPAPRQRRAEEAPATGCASSRDFRVLL